MTFAKFLSLAFMHMARCKCSSFFIDNSKGVILSQLEKIRKEYSNVFPGFKTMDPGTAISMLSMSGILNYCHTPQKSMYFIRYPKFEERWQQGDCLLACDTEEVFNDEERHDFYKIVIDYLQPLETTPPWE